MSEAKDDRNGSALPAIGLVCITVLAVVGVMAASEQEPEATLESREILLDLARHKRIAESDLESDGLSENSRIMLKSRISLAERLLEKHASDRPELRAELGVDTSDPIYPAEHSTPRPTP